MYFIDFSTTHKNFFETYSVLKNISITATSGFSKRAAREKEVFLTIEKAALEHALIFYDAPKPEHLMEVMHQDPHCVFHSTNVKKLTKKQLNQSSSVLTISMLQHKFYEKPHLLTSIKREAMKLPYTNKLFFIAAEHANH